MCRRISQKPHRPFALLQRQYGQSFWTVRVHTLIWGIFFNQAALVDLIQLLVLAPELGLSIKIELFPNSNLLHRWVFCKLDRDVKWLDIYRLHIPLDMLVLFACLSSSIAWGGIWHLNRSGDIMNALCGTYSGGRLFMWPNQRHLRCSRKACSENRWYACSKLVQMTHFFWLTFFRYSAGSILSIIALWDSDASPVVLGGYWSRSNRGSNHQTPSHKSTSIPSDVYALVDF